MHEIQRAATDHFRFIQHQEAKLGLPSGSLVSESVYLLVTLALDGCCSPAEREDLIADLRRIPGELRGGHDVSVRPLDCHCLLEALISPRPPSEVDTQERRLPDP